jgi:MFS family permease
MLYVICWLTDFASVLFIFSATRALAEQGTGSIAMGSIGAIYFLTAAASNTFWGRIADRWGRRQVVLAGTVVMLVCTLLAASQEMIPGLIYPAFVVGGVAAGMIWPAVMAWLGRETEGRSTSRAYLLFCIAFNLGMASGQSSGGWLFDRFGIIAPLLISAGLTTISFVCAWFLTELSTQDVQKPVADDPHLVHREIARAFARLSWVANFGGMFAMSTVWFLFPQLVVSLGVGADSHGIILALGRGITISVFILMHFFQFWRFRFLTAALAQATGVAGLVMVSTATTEILLAGGIAALSVMMGYNYFSSLTYHATGYSDRRRGMAFGLQEAFLAFGAAGGSCLGGIAGAFWGENGPFRLAAALVAILIVLQWVLWWRLVYPLQRQRIRTATEPSESKSMPAL